MQQIKKVIKNTKFNTLKKKVSNLEKKIPDLTTLIYINQCNTGKQNFEKRIRDAYKKTPDVSGLVTPTVLNTKISCQWFSPKKITMVRYGTLKENI